jgi:hypothetical protein
MAIDYDWAGFRALAKRLDELVGGEREDEQFAEDLRRALAFLYTAGITMPSAGDVYDAAGGDEFWNDTVKLDAALDGDETIDAQFARLSARIARSVAAEQADADLDEDELADLADTAAQGALDAAKGISDGSAYFDEKRLDEAAWEWAFGFDEWGSNAVAALAALHELLWGAR